MGVKSTKSKPQVPQNCTKLQYWSKSTGGYSPPLASSPGGISQNHLFREQLASRLSQVFSYQDFIWTGQPSSRDTTSALGLYNAHCLPRTLHYTWACSKLTSASNDSSLSCGSALSGEAVCWPQGHAGVTCLHPWRGRGKINSTNNLKKERLRGHLNGNKTLQSQEKRDEECIWSGVAYEGAGVMYLPVVEEVFRLFT